MSESNDQENGGKRELSEKEIAQRREAGRKGGLARKGQPLSEAELQQRRDAAQLSTGPRTEEGKAASSRNNWRTGEYSAITKMDLWQRTMLQVHGKPCQSTCEEYPCKLVEDGLTQPGGDCMDKSVFVQAFDAIMATLATGDVQHAHGMIGAQIAGAMEILQKLRDEIVKQPIAYKPLVNKSGDHIGDVPMANPVLSQYVKLLGELGINLPEMMATPKAILQQKNSEEATDAVGELFGKLAQVANGTRPGRVINGEAE